MEQANVRPRRRHDAELKRQVLAECAEPGASVAAVALSHGLNANLVHKWRRQAAGEVRAARPRRGDVFVPLAVTPGATVPAADIRIELRRGTLAVHVTWPLGASIECAAWLREILR